MTENWSVSYAIQHIKLINFRSGSLFQFFIDQSMSFTISADVTTAASMNFYALDRDTACQRRQQPKEQQPLYQMTRKKASPLNNQNMKKATAYTKAKATTTAAAATVQSMLSRGSSHNWVACLPSLYWIAYHWQWSDAYR